MFSVNENATLLGTPEVSGDNLARWALAKGVAKKYADLAPVYLREGSAYGVRGDIAFCQSILETGWFWGNNTPFDVKPSQNNFAGLGATGGGVPGDSFPDAVTGIRAQIQDLALRADVKIPREQVLSAYARKVYDTITSYHHKYWKQLAGTWAADTTYWTQIQALMANYNAWEKTAPQPDPTPVPGPTTTPLLAVKGTSTAAQNVLFALNQYSPFEFQLVDPYKPDPTPQPDPKPDPKPDNSEPLLWIPFAKRAPFDMKTAGTYSKGYPIGAIVHFTAGATRGDGGYNSLEWGRDQGFAFLCILRDGTLWQAHPLNKWGHHAGSSHWQGIDGDVSDDLVGIEVCCAGGLEKIGDRYYSWFDKNTPIPAEEVRVDANGRGWHAYSPEQEATLKKLLVWLAKNSPIFRWQFVLGHDEVAPGRKNDPGHSISIPMPELRAWLKAQLADN